MNRRSLVDLAVSQAAPLLGGFLVTFGSAALLGPAGRGELAFVTSTCTVAGGVLFASLHVGATHTHTSGTAGLRRGAGLAGAIIGGGVLLGLLVTLLLPGGSHVGPVGRSGLVVLVLGSGLVAANLYVLRTVQGLGQHRAFRNAWAIQSLLYLCLGLPAAVLARQAGPVVAAWFVALLVATAYGMRTYAALARTGPTAPASGWSVLRSSLTAHVGTVGIQLLYRVDIVVLGVLATAHEVGLYSVAGAVSGLVWVLAEAFSLAAFSRSGSQSATQLHARDRHLLQLTAAMSLVAALVLGVLSITLLGRLLPAYAASVPLVLVLLPGVVLQGPSRVAFSSLLRRSDARPAMRVGLVSLALSVVYLPCAARWGAAGVASASSVIYAAQAALVLTMWRRAGAGADAGGEVDGPPRGTETAIA